MPFVHRHPVGVGSVRVAVFIGGLLVALHRPCPIKAQDLVPEPLGRWVATSSVSPDSVVGLVVDAVRGKPLAGASVSIEGSNVTILTDSLGRFRIYLAEMTATEFVLRFESFGYDAVRLPVQRTRDAGIAVQAGLKKHVIARCGLVVCTGGYNCAPGVRLVVHGLIRELDDGTPVSLIVRSGSAVDTAVTHVGDERETYLAAGGDFDTDGPLEATVLAPGFSAWHAEGIWLLPDPCSAARTTPWINVWLLPPLSGDSLSNKR